MSSEGAVREFSSKTMVWKGTKEGAYAGGALQLAFWLIQTARFNEWSFWAEDTDGQAAIILSVLLVGLVKVARNFMKERVVRPVLGGNAVGQWAVLVACAAVGVPFVRAIGMCGLALAVLVGSSGCASVQGRSVVDASFTAIQYLAEPEVTVVDGEAVDLEPLSESVTVVLANDEAADVIAAHAGRIQDYTSFRLFTRTAAGVEKIDRVDFIYKWDAAGGSISIGSNLQLNSAQQAAMIEAMTPTLTGMVTSIIEQLIAGGVL